MDLTFEEAVRGGTFSSKVVYRKNYEVLLFPKRFSAGETAKCKKSQFYPSPVGDLYLEALFLPENTTRETLFRIGDSNPHMTRNILFSYTARKTQQNSTLQKKI